MGLFPLKEFTIDTNRTTEQANECLKIITIQTDEEFGIKFDYKRKFFKGSVNNDEFRLTPRGLLYSRRATRPFISGQVEEDETGRAYVSGTMEWDKLTRFIFIAAYLAVMIMAVVFEYPLFITFTFITLVFWIVLGIIKMLFKANASTCMDVLNGALIAEDEADEEQE